MCIYINIINNLSLKELFTRISKENFKNLKLLSILKAYSVLLNDPTIIREYIIYFNIMFTVVFPIHIINNLLG